MGKQDDLAALVGDLGDGRRHALDAGGIADLPSSIGTLRSTRTSTRLPLRSTSSRVREVASTAQISLPMATAVSAMRLEKPHSLSYQDITRTSVPSMTLVWSMWKIEERGSWLKSIETLGWSV